MQLSVLITALYATVSINYCFICKVPTWCAQRCAGGACEHDHVAAVNPHRRRRRLRSTQAQATLRIRLQAYSCPFKLEMPKSW